MKRALGLALVLALGGVAAAGPLPAGLVTPPQGWTETPAPTPTAPPPAAGSSATAAYQAADGHAMLYVTRRERAVTEATRDQLATAELAQLVAAPGKGTVIDGAAKRADRTQQQLEASLAWHDDSMQLVDTSRSIVAATPTTLVAVTGECIVAQGTPEPIVQACQRALDSLQIDLASEVRVALVITGDLTAVEGPPTTAPTTTQLDGLPAPEPAAPTTAPAAPLSAPALTLSPHDSMAPIDGRAHFGPIVVGRAPAPPADRRPFIVGVGVLLFAVLLYWNKQRRERFEQEDGRPVRKPRAERTRNRDRDPDANDLHAAAADPDGPDSPKDV